jgi:hypothetical protein
VHQGKFNFAGELSIAKERKTETIDVNLHHRIAFHKTQIETQFSSLLITHPLKLGFAFRDDFLKEFSHE